jgi:hypothetical protein
MASLSDMFKYMELEDHPNCFRIVDLHPGQADDPIHCALRHGRLDEPPKISYFGLSYAWGDPERTHQIYVDGSPFSATANLHAALHGLRESSEIVTLWADAICINQSHTAEKNRQVQLMQNIYAKAVHVVVWLGEASENSDHAIAFIKQVCARLDENGIVAEDDLDPVKYVENDFQQGLGNYLEPEFADDWEAVADLLMRPWWSRAWIVQELVSAKTAEFRCGNASIPWRFLSIIISLLAHCSIDITRFPHPFRVSNAMDRAWSLLYINHDFANKGHIDFLRLLDHRRRSCLDPVTRSSRFWA